MTTKVNKCINRTSDNKMDFLISSKLQRIRTINAGHHHRQRLLAEPLTLFPI